TASSATLRELAASTTGPRVLRRLAMAAGLTVGAFVAGAALLALAGWFIAASAVAGLAVTTTFSFLYPSAAIRALALARTAGRYGERISTHSVTLKLVGRLRVTLFERALALPRDRVAALRSSNLLGRITADTDAVDNVLLRSAFPAIVAATALIAAGAFFAVFSPALGFVVPAGMVLTGGLLVLLAHQRAQRPALALVAARARPRRSAPAYVMACLVAIVACEPLASLPAGVTALARARAAAARLTDLFPPSAAMVPEHCPVPRGAWTVDIEVEHKGVAVVAGPGD